MIGAGGRVLGVLDIDSTDLDAFDATDAEWLERILARAFGDNASLT